MFELVGAAAREFPQDPAFRGVPKIVVVIVVVVVAIFVAVCGIFCGDCKDVVDLGLFFLRVHFDGLETLDILYDGRVVEESVGAFGGLGSFCDGLEGVLGR
jgi:hypothetical protein